MKINEKIKGETETDFGLNYKQSILNKIKQKKKKGNTKSTTNKESSHIPQSLPPGFTQVNVINVNNNYTNNIVNNYNMSP